MTARKYFEKNSLLKNNHVTILRVLLKKLFKELDSLRSEMFFSV